MRVDEFLNKVRADAIITLERDVSVPGPEARALLTSGRVAIPLAEYLNHPDRHTERRTFRYGHLLGAGLSPAALDDWQSRFPHAPLPEDLRQFLLVANGVHLWADLDEQRAYFGISPLDDWSDVATHPYGYVFDTPPPGALVISYRSDTAGFAVLDTAGPTYFWCELIGEPEPIGTTVESLLEHWWQHCRLEPRL
jgi:hypothetical protein